MAGVYPLLKDETCWFIAVDFDKGSWREDVSAFRETRSNMGIPVANKGRLQNSWANRKMCQQFVNSEKEKRREATESGSGSSVLSLSWLTNLDKSGRRREVIT